MKFYKCKICGQIVGMVKQTNSPLVCCGQEMVELEAHQDEIGLMEKHVPTFLIKDNKVVVKVGENLHPSSNEHYIEWIALVTNKGNQRKCLKPGDTPIVIFCIEDDEEVEEVFAYCNLHSLWKTKK